MAYHLTRPLGDDKAATERRNQGVGVVFLGGFRSDMTGTKATHLEAWAAARGQGFLRFDYTGHGASSGRFEDGAIGDWADDAYEAITRLTEGPQILVGSSMGGWIALLVMRRLLSQGAPARARVAGFVGIAAAPDFTEDSMAAGFSDAQKAALSRDGRLELPSDYGDEPYVVTHRLIEDGRNHLTLRTPLALPIPVRLLQGSADADVPTSVALRLLEHIDCEDARLILVKGADHRMSEPRELDLLTATIEEVLERVLAPT
ncbi:MAG: alpha/beta fold hydrolase [Pseudomonadota bacterium]